MNCVITAGPSAGKTSTLRELSARGYRTLPEAARIVIDQAISEGADPKAVKSASDFQDRVERENRRIEAGLDDDEVVFLDRSLADNIAYRELFEGGAREQLWEECRDRYDLVFRLERLEYDEDDYARSGSEDRAQRIHRKLQEVYENLGYEVVDVPLIPIDERADFVLDHVRRKRQALER